jgi:hypothetical protein
MKEFIYALLVTCAGIYNIYWTLDLAIRMTWKQPTKK